MAEKILAINKQARGDYDILETYEAGIRLTGPEVKSTKQSRANLKGSYAVINSSGVPILVGCHISAYRPAAGVQVGYDPERPRELLLREREIATLIGKLKEKRFALVPLAIKSRQGLVKVELGLGRGKKKYEKREEIKKKDIERDIQRYLRKK